MMPSGPILLTIVVVLIYFGFLERVLDRMRMSNRTALLIAIAMLFGSLFDLTVAPGLRINVGGGILPLAVVGYLIVTADQIEERFRAIGAGAVTAGIVYLVGRAFPPGEPTELNLFLLDAQYLYGFVGGLVGYLAGRSRRAAFSAGVLGVMIADLAHYFTYASVRLDRNVVVSIGGGGFQDTAVVAGVLAVLLAEFIGEAREAFAGGPAAHDHGAEGDGPNGG